MKITYETALEISNSDRDEICNKIRAGFISGVIDNEKYGIVWDISIDKLDM